MSRAMKDSGHAWLGDIPAHWKVEKFKNLFQIKKDIAGALGYDVLSVTQKGIKIKDITKNEGQLAQDYSKYQLVYPNDFVMNHMDLLTGYVDCSKQTGVTSPDYRTFKAIDIDKTLDKYYLRIFQFCYTDAIFYKLGQGVSNFGRWRLPADQQNSFLLPLPSKEEQLAIADFLNIKCAEVDELIALQEKMIDELKLYKQSVITEAVTKGLNPDAPMRDSGIEWIVQIPEHWSIAPFKTIYKLTKGLTITKSDLVEDGIPVISYGQIHSKLNTGTNINNYLIRYVPNTFLDNNVSSLVNEGDVIFADTSEDLEGCGNCIYIDKEMTLFAGYHTIIAKNTAGLSNRYLAYLFKTDCWRYQLRTTVNGVKLFSISQKLLAATNVILPSATEQQTIADYLDQKCAEIDELSSIKQQKIDELKEYRKSIIYEYVTGKKQVNIE
jgi:type I restriction enzyme S subunit